MHVFKFTVATVVMAATGLLLAQEAGAEFPSTWITFSSGGDLTAKGPIGGGQTHFSSKDTLYIEVGDIQLGEGVKSSSDAKRRRGDRVQVHLEQKSSNDKSAKSDGSDVTIELTEGEGGVFFGSVPLNGFDPGRVRVTIEAKAGRFQVLYRRASIYVDNFR